MAQQLLTVLSESLTSVSITHVGQLKLPITLALGHLISWPLWTSTLMHTPTFINKTVFINVEMLDVVALASNPGTQAMKTDD